MQSGRKPKPTAVKALEGNPGKRSLNTGEPKPEKKAPRCPASMSWYNAESFSNPIPPRGVVAYLCFSGIASEKISYKKFIKCFVALTDIK